MNDRAQFSISVWANNPRLVELTDEMTRRLELGESLDVDAFAEEHSEYADEIRKVYPAVRAMVDLGTSATGDTSPHLPAAQHVEGVLGDYRIIREIGRGGMGDVYEAEQLSLKRRVALKVLPFASMLEPRNLQRFKNEAQAAAVLRHPHIVSVHAVGFERGMHFYAMDLVEGQSWAEMIRDLQAGQHAPSDNAHPDSTTHDQTSTHHRHASLHPPLGRVARNERGGSSVPEVGKGQTSEGLPPTLSSPEAQLSQRESEICQDSSCVVRRDDHTAGVDTQPVAALSTAHANNRRDFFRSVAQLGIQAAQALQYAHECGIVHRDIKPSNLLVDRHAKLWVTDFGLAMTQAGDGLTLTGDLIGTVRYMSPEQAAGNKAMMDHRTDIYSLGVSLYELVTLRPAFEGGDRQALLRKIDEQDAPLPSSIDAAIPRDLETIVLKAMAKSPHERYATAGELAEDLQRFLELKPIRARRSTRVQKLSRWAKRNPRLATASVIAAILTTILAVGGPIAALRQSQLAQDKDALAQNAQALAEDAQALAGRLELQLYDSEMAKAHAAVLKHQFLSTYWILKEWVPEPGAEDHRSFEWYHLWRSCHGALNVPQIEPARAVQCADYSPDGNYVALGIVESGFGGVRLYDLRSHDFVWTHWETQDNPVSDLVFTPGSEVLITAGGRAGTIRFWQVSTGELLQTEMFVDSGLAVTSLAISGDQFVAGFGHLDQDSNEPIHISVWKLARDGDKFSLQSPRRLSGLSGQVLNMAISPDGRLLAASCLDNRVRLFRLEDGHSLPPLEGHSGTVRDVAFSPVDGNLLASSSYQESATDQGGGEIKLWDVQKGTEIATLRRNVWPRCLDFSTDGRQLAAGDHDGAVLVFDVGTRELLSKFPAHGLRINQIQFSPNSNRFLTASFDRRCKFWDLPEGADRPLRIAGQGAGIQRLDVSHDSRLLLAAGEEGIAELWDTQTGREITTIEPAKRMKSVFAAEFSPDGKYVAIGGGAWPQSGELMEFFVWNVKTEETKTLFSGTSSEEQKGVFGVAFSPASDRVAAGIGKEIRIWRVEDIWKVPDARPWKILPSEFVCRDLAWSNHTNRIASFSRAPSFGIKLWDGSGEELPTLPVPTDVRGLLRLSFSPDGRTLAVATTGSEILLFDVINYRLLERFGDHTDWIWDVTFSPDGRRLAWGNGDRTVKLWNLETETETALLTFREPRSLVQAVRFSPDGRALFAAANHGRDSVIHVWRAATRNEVQQQEVPSRQ